MKRQRVKKEEMKKEMEEDEMMIVIEIELGLLIIELMIEQEEKSRMGRMKVWKGKDLRLLME